MSEYAKFLSFLKFIPAVLRFLIGLFLICKKDWRLINNLSNKILIVGSTSNPMNVEVDLLKKAGFFKSQFSGMSDGMRIFDTLSDYGLVVIGYTKEETDLRIILEKVRNSRIPVVVYTQEFIDKNSDDMRAMQNYSFCEMVNSPLRLMNIIFSIYSTHSYGRR